MPLERIDHGGEISMTRDESLGVDERGFGIFTIGQMQEFVDEAQLNGAVSTTRVWHEIFEDEDDLWCGRMIVKTENGVVPYVAPPVPVPVIDPFLVRHLGLISLVVVAIGMFIMGATIF